MDNISMQDVRKGRFGEPTLFLHEVRKEGINCVEKDKTEPSLYCSRNLWYNFFIGMGTK